MKLYFWFLIILISLVGCKKNIQQDEGEVAYFGGEIINPNTNFVVIGKSDKVFDTILLDKNNRFSYKLKHLKPGLYTFKHGSEVQMVFLEPMDSIIFRLNTLEFDESLVYTGIGAKKNNYFMNEFLKNESLESDIFKYCQLEPLAFEHKIDSLRNIKNKKLQRFSKKHKTSSLFNRIAQANIDYKYYTRKEIYPFVHYGEGKHNIINSLPDSFYSYRKNIDYNDDFLKDYFSYNDFLRSNLNNLALKQHFKHTKECQVKRNSLCYNLDRLNIIDSLVSNETIKNDLLYHNTMSFLAKNKNLDNNSVVLKSFLEKSTDEKNKTVVSQYVASLNNLRPGQVFPNIKIVNYQNTEFNSNSLINAPTAICFWSHSFYEHFRKSHNKIKELRVKYPEINFIIINIDDYGTGKWVSTLEKNKFPLKGEYQFKTPEASRNLLAIHPMTKVIVVNKHNRIVNNNANIFAVGFEQELLGLINQ
ncbi:hypothetical protein APS56_01065 [Pseudalgibacter alginicilyticus]|uniref:Thioredoxin domain-containing protein n=1 Tax=Pseudalgibacter alginicilyticus TaxID=1736674 RepID=A0A0P0CCX6_9FLAO|nr:hypothetical protein [Pseudalgibacter alginicilyticus]ALJ03824.1 hypothetical protein APS56_01065 [Pseudalgibacter alginicilyticus]